MAVLVAPLVGKPCSEATSIHSSQNPSAKSSQANPAKRDTFLASNARSQPSLDLGHRRPPNRSRHHLHLPPAPKPAPSWPASYSISATTPMIALATIIGTHGFTKIPPTNSLVAAPPRCCRGCALARSSEQSESSRGAALLRPNRPGVSHPPPPCSRAARCAKSGKS